MGKYAIIKWGPFFSDFSLVGFTDVLECEPEYQLVDYTDSEELREFVERNKKLENFKKNANRLQSIVDTLFRA
jgi:hypothetical protein